MNKQRIRQLIGENAIILEIGAADGSDTRELIEIGAVYAFEPDPGNIELLEQLGKPFILFPGVVSDVDGTVTFNRSKNEKEPGALSLSGSIMKPKNHLKIWDWISFDERITVPSIRLDTAFKDFDRIDFIWCDVQGAEEKVILGGLETFRKVRYFYTEYSNDEQYEGQPTLGRIMELLPDFETLLDYGGDALLKNTKL